MPVPKSLEKLRDAWRINDMAELETEDGLRRARLYDTWFDQSFIRRRWTNLAERAPGFWRSNQPGEGRIAEYAALGIRSVISLRGGDNPALDARIRQRCANHEITWASANLNARKAPKREQLLHLIDLLKSAERPMLVHCKSGADRAGFATAVYRMVVLGDPVEVARRELSARYLHFRLTATGILDHVLDRYAAIAVETRPDFETWVRETYTRKSVTRSFTALRWWQR